MTPHNIVITGASAGIGAATARRFAKDGHVLVLIARRQDKLEALRQQLGPQKVMVIPLDLSSSSAVQRAVEKIEEELGSIDLLINNAGSAFGLDKAQEAKLEDWERCIDINVKGLVYCTHAVLPGMVKRNRGHIINLSSIAAHNPYPGGNVYGATKAFVSQFSKELRSDLFGTPVRISCIEPGLVGGTEFSTIRFGGDAAKAKKVYEATQPLQPEDIAETIYFCYSTPQHVNINTIEVMPTVQSWAALSVYKNNR